MFSLQRFGGVTRYFCELMKNLPGENQFKLSVLFSSNQYLKENKNIFKTRDLLPAGNFKGKYYIEKQLTAINRQYSKKCIAQNNFDVFHPTYNDNYFLNLLKKPFVITVHDLIIFKFGDTFYKNYTGKSNLANAITRANRIIAISNNTKKDLLELFNVSEDRVDVIYHGHNKTGVTSKKFAFKNYILFVGRRDLYKNFIPFVKAIHSLLLREPDLKLICVGQPFDKTEMELFHKLGIGAKLTALNADEASLNNLYAGARLFVFPSLYEGFGFPILEAFANECPVCLSNASCFPEIAKEGAVYFDPNDQESMLSAVEAVLYNEELKKQIVAAGSERLNFFSWQKTAIETMNTYSKAKY